MAFHHVVAGLLAALCCADSVSTQARQGPRIELTCGVYTSDRATTMYRMFTPVLEQLQDGLEERLHRPVNIELRICKTYDEALQAFVEGKVDFVRFGPASYVLAKDINPEVELLAMESKDGERVFQGMIVVLKDSPIKKLDDLRGCSFAFGDENSTIGRFLAQDQLLKAGIKAADLDRYAYLGRHDVVYTAVEVGDFDAGSLKDSTFRKLNKKNQLRVLVAFDNVTKPWVAREGLDPAIKRALRASLLAIDDEEALRALKVDGFLPADDEHFAVTRSAMARARAFEPPPAKCGK